MTLGMMASDVEQRVDFETMRKYRLARAREQMEKYDLGALLCFDLDNIRYITSTHLAEWARGKYWRWCLLPRGGEPILYEVGTAAVVKRELCPWLKPENIRPAVTWNRGTNVREVNLALSRSAIAEIKNELVKCGAAGLPVGVDEVEMYTLQALQEAGLRVANGYDAMFDARIVKSPEELKLIEMSASLVDGVYAQVVDFVKPGVREDEVVGMIYGWLISHGVDRISGVNCVSGPRSNPHPHDYSDRMIRPGELVFIDIMSHYLGYATCYYRTFAVTRSTQRQRDVYKRAMDWLQASIDVVKPGITTADIAAQWPSAKELGYASEEEAFALALGHGIGLSHHEKPWISRAYSLDHPVPIEANMHFALETFYGEGDDGARIESQVIVTKDGHRVITKWPCEELMVCNPK
ncbi:MAG: Xaa-Pro peptidase family protein [Chloroflexi bacterium]|nr:Xaa-Pro peptidase family protein [Chloroflexota bacterium]